MSASLIVRRWSLARAADKNTTLSRARHRLLRSVIPTGVRPSASGWANGVEEPAVRLSQQRSRILSNFTVAGILFLWIPCAAPAQTGKSQDAPQQQLAEITRSLMNGSVASIEILHLPDQVETRVSVTPENLEKWFDFKITINKVPEWSGSDDLVKALRSTRLAPASRMADMRSAIIFNRSDGKCVGTLYFGRFFGRYVGQFGGADGAIGNVSVSFNGDLPTWLKNMIPPPLR